MPAEARGREAGLSERSGMFFFVRTQNPRPTFHLDMTADERETMARHVAYWTRYAQEGVAVVFGPVADPGGYWGMGVYRVQEEAHMQRLLAEDPANGLLAYEVFPMPCAVVGCDPGGGAS
jgi:hypothetical protein